MKIDQSLLAGSKSRPSSLVEMQTKQTQTVKKKRMHRFGRSCAKAQINFLLFGHFCGCLTLFFFDFSPEARVPDCFPNTKFFILATDNLGQASRGIK